LANSTPIAYHAIGTIRSPWTTPAGAAALLAHWPDRADDTERYAVRGTHELPPDFTV
jgi:hypothetical protein